MGMRQSFIRKPGTEQVLVRIGIGRDGVFKVDGVENKVSQKQSSLRIMLAMGGGCDTSVHPGYYVVYIQGTM